MPCRPRSRRRHAQEHHHRKRAHREDSQLILVSRLATYAPLVAVFLLALLMGFAGRVLLPQQHQSSLSVAGALGAISHSASAAAVPVVNRRRLIALSSPFRVNPLAGQVSSAATFLPCTSLGEPFWSYPSACGGRQCIQTFMWLHSLQHPIVARLSGAIRGSTGRASDGRL